MRVVTRGRPHWSAILFTIAVGVVSFALVGRALTSPLPTLPPEIADEPSPTPTSDRVPLVAELHSQWYTQTASPSLSIGEVADVTVQFRNVGLTAWIRMSPSELRLGEVGDRPLPPEMRVDWAYPDRPAVQTEAIVHPQQIATFSFKVKAVAPGTFRLRLRPVVDGVTWLDDEGVFVDILVS